MEDDKDYDVELDDQLQAVYVPRLTAAAQAEAKEAERQRRFQERWMEKTKDESGDGDEEEDEEEADDDIGANFDGRDGGIPNANRDVRRLLDNIYLLHTKRPMPSANVGRRMVLLDRARRLAFGYVKPPPMTLLGGQDGGVNIAHFQTRRVRPPAVAAPPTNTSMWHTDEKGALVRHPRQPGDTDTPCRPPPANQFDPGPRPAKHRRRDKGEGKGIAREDHSDGSGGGGASSSCDGRSGSKRKRRDSRPSLRKRQKAAATHLLRQPIDSAVHAALRHFG
ncbi:hypothetical protein SPI_05132 [Niveomyces insectorum RCEF 264]|uniref:Uncharacterized protein n=1 Tax=Niveomyces insectorum RCEF 264 TaxID=1081102 RepID=A0A167TZD8_9HYPO|nr:hypothetical protein SPI_05132 [Niveomyces insectorum RCEF 264]